MVCPVPFGELKYLVFVDVDLPALPLEALPDQPKIQLENFPSRCQIELWVMQADVDSGRERLVEVANAVRGEEQNAGVILQHTQED
jgi:hypothetical protein